MSAFRRFSRYRSLMLPFALLAAAGTSALADERQASLIQQEQARQEQQRLHQLEQQMQPAPDVRLERSAEAVSSLQLPQNESPCFPVRDISLVGDSAAKFQFALDRALGQSGFKPGMCLGAQGINHIMTLAQNAVIGRGYTTTRILAAPQDLNGGKLELTVLAGKIGRIRFDESHAAETHIGRITAFQNEFPSASESLLNLRGLEQGLENLKRVPTAEADIQIVPSEQPDVSDVVVKWRQRTAPYRLTLGFDDSGSKATGRYQGNATFSADNPFGLSDLFYASYHHDLGSRSAQTDSEGHTVKGATDGYAFHYSVPFRNWLWSWNHSHYRYHQAVAGDTRVYDYNGKSRNSDIGVSRLLYRDARRKTHAAFKWWQRETQSFIDDAEIGVQHRRTAGWSAALTHREYIGQAVLNLGLGYKRGTGRNNSLSAPEEAFGEGTSRMKIITADAGLNLPFRIGRQNFAFDSNLHAQWNKTPLTPQERISIGNRYTVRGFDGETTLSAERGGYWRNDLSWQYLPNHRLYAAVDGGRVSGPSAAYLPGKSLAGAALGLRGQAKAGGALAYDVFAAKPLHKPERFQTAQTAFGFNLNYSF
ncbi:ShlB/FhaC/HecB family hemolysin secretion/activation protein [Neisseria musculi]|uniref:Hemolysin secretion/activation ShlB/FhaC/HecB family protein n=1 Tax=Neisseria musculi TaxID=1815583 RepID=A0ACD0ZNR6_9NEIS|nr:ShlB/FhaC/HecB family hemolysin secretion/activation protein [Neisseria musculi]